jgi:hypothetical protein
VPLLLFTLLRQAESRWLELALAAGMMAAGAAAFGALIDYRLMP